MSTFSSETDVANSALIKVGADLITSIDDDNERARVLKSRLPFVRDGVLRSHPWNFALKRVQLAQTLNTPVYDFSNEFQIPSDVLRIISTNLDPIVTYSDKKVTTSYGVSLPSWTIEGDKLLSNDTTVKILYIARISDVTLWPSNFGEVVALGLAKESCYKFTQNRALMLDLAQEYEKQLAFARNFDAQENGRTNIETYDWIVSRY